MNNTFRFFLQSISVGIFLLFFSFQTEAHGINASTFSFDKCTGNTTINFQTYRQGDWATCCERECDDYLKSAEISYRNKSGGWSHLYDYNICIHYLNTI